MNLRGALLLIFLIPPVVLAEIRPRPLAWAQPMLGSDLENFYRVSTDVYRSKQPNADEMGELERMGVRTILNLREYHTDDREARHTGLKLYRIPVNAGEIDDNFMVRALGTIARSDKPILIHCWHGSDRTGVVVAMYRMVIQGWPREAAIDEFINGGYGYHATFYPNIERYLRRVDINAIGERIRAEGAQSENVMQIPIITETRHAWINNKE